MNKTESHELWSKIKKHGYDEDWLPIDSTVFCAHRKADHCAKCFDSAIAYDPTIRSILMALCGSQEELIVMGYQIQQCAICANMLRVKMRVRDNRGTFIGPPRAAKVCPRCDLDYRACTNCGEHQFDAELYGGINGRCPNCAPVCQYCKKSVKSNTGPCCLQQSLRLAQKDGAFSLSEIVAADFIFDPLAPTNAELRAAARKVKAADVPVVVEDPPFAAFLHVTQRADLTQQTVSTYLDRWVSGRDLVALSRGFRLLVRTFKLPHYFESTRYASAVLHANIRPENDDTALVLNWVKEAISRSWRMGGMPRGPQLYQNTRITTRDIVLSLPAEGPEHKAFVAMCGGEEQPPEFVVVDERMQVMRDMAMLDWRPRDNIRIENIAPVGGEPDPDPQEPRPRPWNPPPRPPVPPRRRRPA